MKSLNKRQARKRKEKWRRNIRNNQPVGKCSFFVTSKENCLSLLAGKKEPLGKWWRGITGGKNEGK